MVKRLKELAPQLTLIIAAAGVLGSLFFSEMMGLEACKACWYQRVALYPMPIFILIAQLRGQKGYLHYLLPLAVFGWFVSVLQVSDQTFGTHLLGVINCSGGVSCSVVDLALGGFITIPIMSLVAFSIMIVGIVLSHVWPKSSNIKFSIRRPEDLLQCALLFIAISAVGLSLYLSDVTAIGNTESNWWERIFLFPVLVWVSFYAWRRSNLLPQIIVFCALALLVSGFNLLIGLFGLGVNEITLQHPLMLSVVSVLGSASLLFLAVAAQTKAR
jgi:disulfide bond formation protein DsbB